MRKLPFTIAAAAVCFFASNALADSADDVMSKNKCSGCHTATTTKKAPSFADIAKKYQGNAGAEAKIVEMLKTGGAEDHKKIAASDADLKAVAQKVLASK